MVNNFRWVKYNREDGISIYGAFVTESDGKSSIMPSELLVPEGKNCHPTLVEVNRLKGAGQKFLEVPANCVELIGVVV